MTTDVKTAATSVISLLRDAINDLAHCTAQKFGIKAQSAKTAHSAVHEQSSAPHDSLKRLETLSDDDKVMLEPDIIIATMTEFASIGRRCSLGSNDHDTVALCDALDLALTRWSPDLSSTWIPSPAGANLIDAAAKLIKRLDKIHSLNAFFRLFGATGFNAMEIVRLAQNVTSEKF